MYNKLALSQVYTSTKAQLSPFYTLRDTKEAETLEHQNDLELLFGGKAKNTILL